MSRLVRYGLTAALGSGRRSVPRTPKPAGPIGLMAIVAGIAVFVCGDVSHTWTVAWFVIVPLAISFFIALGWIFRGAGRRTAISNAIRNLPETQRPATGAELRRRAGELGMASALRSAAGMPPAPALARPRRTGTYRQVMDDQLLTRRMQRIADIMLEGCPVCQAGEAELCRFVPDAPISMLDREQSLVAHDARIGSAIKSGRAKVTDVVAQFDNQVPGTVWEAAL